MLSHPSPSQPVPPAPPPPSPQVSLHWEVPAMFAALAGAAVATGVRWALPKIVNRMIDHEREQLRRIAVLEAELSEVHQKLLNQMVSLTGMVTALEQNRRLQDAEFHAALGRLSDEMAHRFAVLDSRLEALERRGG